ncbi:hypothetical protein JTB14_030652 [Gonioctena quinquepunctata]|nr:hypothetical protein JTB14_030652 [Gonioctena quinquepunctata]
MAKPNVYVQKSSTITGKCVLISEDRFNVELSAFSQEAIEIFKSIPSRYYDQNSRCWSFSLQYYELLITRLNYLKPRLIVEPIPKYVLNCLQMKKDDADIDFERLDPVLYDALMPFQVDAVRFGVDKKGRCLIADDMGLGKTFQALAIANYYMKEWPLLIVTTSSMKAVWEETISQYMPSVSILSIQYMVSGKDYIGDARIVIVSHDMMTRSLQKLLEKRFGVIIIDESHNLKSYKSKCCQSAITLGRRARRMVLLSGTPALSRPSELFTQLSLIDSSFFGSFFEFSKSKEVHDSQDQRRSDAGLPDKKQEIITLDTNLSQFSEEDRTCLLSLANKYNEQKGANKHRILLTFFAETARIKIPSVCSYILQILDNEEKFLVFAHHQVMMNAIEEIVKKKQVHYIRIDGNTTSDQRKYFIDKFQLNQKYKCAILSITAANAGITLTAAHLVLFAELHWNPSIISQAEARAHRIGQKNQVVVRYLISPGTADDSIWPMLQEKQRTLNKAGLCRDSFENITIEKQSKEVVTDGLDFNGSGIAGGNPGYSDVFYTEKKRKIMFVSKGKTF